MKKAIVSYLLFHSLLCCSLSAQTTVTGIYLSAADYINNKVSFETSLDNKTKIKLNTFVNKPYITIINNGKETRLSKDSIFGYSDSKQINFRYNKEDKRFYKIIENKVKVVYSTAVPVLTPKGNALQLTTRYYYSNTLTSAILPLTNNSKK